MPPAPTKPRTAPVAKRPAGSHPFVKTVCPECDARFRAAAGRVVPCPSCGNPVAVGEAPAEPVRSAPVEAPEPAPPAAGIPWAKATLVLLVLALAHYGLYRLVSASARAEIAATESRQGAKVRGEPKPPGDPPPASSAAYAGWLEAKERYDDQRAYREHESHRAWVARGLGLAYLVQVVITAFALFRIASAQERRARMANGRNRRGAARA